MEHQAYVQADGDVGGVSAECKIESRAALQRSQQFAFVARASLPDGCGTAARYSASGERTAGGEDRGAECKALPTPQYLGRGELSFERYGPLRSRPRPWPLPSQHVHVRETHGCATEH